MESLTKAGDGLGRGYDDIRRRTDCQYKNINRWPKPSKLHTYMRRNSLTMETSRNEHISYSVSVNMPYVYIHHLLYILRRDAE